MKLVEETLKKLDGKLLSIERNTIVGKYELKIGLPKKWVYKSTEEINIKLETETDNAKLLIISSNKDDIVIDDLIDFVNFIIDKNEEIQKKEDEIDNIIKKAKEELESKVKTLYNEVENMRTNSFNLNEKNGNDDNQNNMDLNDSILEEKLSK